MANLNLSSTADITDKGPDSQKANTSDQFNAQLGAQAMPRTSFATLEPYNPTLGRGTYRNKNSTRRPHQAYKEHLSLDKIFAPDFYKKFYVMKAINEINLWKEVDVIAANKELEKYIKGTPKRITELKSGAILIEVSNKEQANKITQIKYLNNIKVMVQTHSSLNSTKGTIRCNRFIDTPEDTLLEELKCYDVTEVYKIKRKEQDRLVNTGTIVLTFDRCALPTNVKIGWKSFEVREYIPAPRRCFKCQGFNHSSKSCHAQDSLCVNCGELQHGKECYSPPHCCNCDEAHPASDKNCFYYKLEVEILSVKTKEKISYGEAKRIVLKRFVRPNMTFAQSLKADKGDNVEQHTKRKISPISVSLLSPTLTLSEVHVSRPTETLQSAASVLTCATRQAATAAHAVGTLKTPVSPQATVSSQTSGNKTNGSDSQSKHLSSSNKEKANAKSQTPLPKTDMDKQLPKTTCPSITTMTKPSQENTILRNIPTIMTSNNTKEDHSRKRSIDASTSAVKVAKITEEARLGGNPACIGGIEVPTPTPVPLQVPPNQQSLQRGGTAAASAREDNPAQQRMEVDAITSSYIHPSPIIQTHKPDRSRSSSREKRSDRDRRVR